MTAATLPELNFPEMPNKMVDHPLLGSLRFQDSNLNDNATNQ